MIHLIRHGQSILNMSPYHQGQLNSPLSFTGRHQIRLLGNKLSSARKDVIYSSDLERALHTAKAVSRGETKVLKDSRLRELFEGDWEGKERRTYDKYTNCEDRLSAKAPGGENVHEFVGRVECFVVEVNLFEKAKKEEVYVVSHGGTIKALLQSLIGREMFKDMKLGGYEFENTSISTVSWYGTEWRIESLNDVSHLKLEEINTT